MKKCIGLFGTCGNSTWRDQFVEYYTKNGIEFFNPQVENWTPECATIEAEHLASDNIVLFPITDETYATGSLAEVGFAVANAVLNKHRKFVFLISPTVDEKLISDNQLAAKESTRARALVKKHLEQFNLDNVHVASTMEEMLSKSVVLCAPYDSSKVFFR